MAGLIAYQFEWTPGLGDWGPGRLHRSGIFRAAGYGRRDAVGQWSAPSSDWSRKQAFRDGGRVGEKDLKVAAEYSADWDYTPSQGGTGLWTHGIFGLVQLNF